MSLRQQGKRSPQDAYRWQRRVNTLRKLAVEMDDNLLELSQELLQRAA